MNWYAFTPVDTLFFKGARKWTKGLTTPPRAIFHPCRRPLPALCAPRYYANMASISQISKQGKLPLMHYPWVSENTAKLLRLKLRDLYCSGRTGYLCRLHTPGFGETKTLKKANTFAEVTPIAIRKAAVIRSELVKSRGTELTWNGADPDQDALGGLLVAVDDLNAREAKCYPERLFISREVRTGIALETDKRHVKEGHLYSFTHFRLHEGVRIVFAVNMALPLPASGLLSLGGEKRFGRLDQMPAVDLPQGQENLYLAVSPVLASDENHAALIAGGKIFYRGGWDLAKKFHKPMRGYYPAGSVFKENINNNCIAL